jgi:hypothetical protein
MVGPIFGSAVRVFLPYLALGSNLRTNLPERLGSIVENSFGLMRVLKELTAQERLACQNT